MKKLCSILILLCLVGMKLSAQDMAVATVRYKRTEAVSGRKLEEMIELLKTQQGRDLTLEEKKTVLDTLIDQMLIHQAAEADRNVTVTDTEVEKVGMRLISQELTSVGALPPGAVLTDKAQYRQIIESQGTTLQEFESNVRKQLLAEKYVAFKGRDELQDIEPPTDAEISHEYQKRVQEFVVSDSVWFNHIFFDTRSSNPSEAAAKKTKAEEVHRRLINTPATFVDLVVSESEDDISKARGGLIGPLMKGDPVGEQLYGSKFIDTVFSMRVDEISRVLRSKVGYHIVQITEKKAAQLLPKDSPEVKPYLRELISLQKYQVKFDKIAMRLVAELRGESTINYFGEYK